MNDYPEDLEAVRARMLAAVSGPSGSAGGFLQTLLSRPGKLLRPRLLCLSARACAKAAEGALPDRVIDLAAAVELLHLASLVHDDIIDESPLRRGAPSLNALHGARLAVLSGDWLISRALALGWNALGREADAAPFALSLGRMVEGEIAQADGRWKAKPGRRDYSRRIHAKTALLFDLSCRLGARAIEARPSWTQALGRFGHNLGMAFQIRDDILDFKAEPSALGKPAGSDLAAGIYTLPLIEALFLPGSDVLKKLISRPPFRGWRFRSIRGAVLNSGGMEAAEAVEAAHTDRALRELSALPESPARTELSSLCASLPLRQS